MKKIKVVLSIFTFLFGIATVVFPILHRMNNQDYYVVLGYLSLVVFFIDCIILSLLNLHIKIKQLDFTKIDKDEIISKLKQRKDNNDKN